MLTTEQKARLLYMCEIGNLAGLVDFDELIDYFLGHTMRYAKDVVETSELVKAFQFFLNGFMAAHEL